MELQNLKNKKIAILGYGREGNSTLRFLTRIGCTDITILDKNTEISPVKWVKSQFGEDYLSGLGSFDVIFKSPGVCPYNEELIAYKEKFISQTQVFYENYAGKVIAVTGTKGKSTTSTLIFLALKEAGFNVKLVGNIGNPVLDEIDILAGETYDFVIYEMSSYMLEGFIPKTFISVFNNIYNCHLDWHRGFENYKNAKLNILRNSEHALVNWEFKEFDEVKNLSSETSFFGVEGQFSYKDKAFYIGEEKVLDDKDIILLGEHNKKNISAVIGVLSLATGDNTLAVESVRKVITTFIGLPHRMENIGTYKGITFINDSIATTPESTIAAVKTFSPQVGTIFIGGYDSGFVYDELEKFLLETNIENYVLFPDTGYKLFAKDIENQPEEKEFTIEKNGKTLRILKTRSMENAVLFSYTNTKPGFKALLSCASQSFSLWRSYEVKGQAFKDAVIKFSK